MIIITPDQIGPDKKYGDAPFHEILGIELQVVGWNNRRYALTWSPGTVKLSAIAVATGIFLHQIKGPEVIEFGDEDHVHLFDGTAVHIFLPDLEAKRRRLDLTFRQATRTEWEEALLPLYLRDEMNGK